MPSIPRHRGFTLLEMLTVLAIGTLLLVTLQQAFYAATRSAERVHDVADGMMRGVLHDAWLRQVIAGAAAEESAGKPGFEGDIDRIAGRAGMPLFAGGDGRFLMELKRSADEGVQRLTYRQGEREVRLGAYPEGSRFVFLDDAGQLRDRWPPSGNPALYPPLPAVVMIATDDGRAAFAAALPRSVVRRNDATPFGTPLQ